MSVRSALPTMVFDHLVRLSDDRGLFEHAELSAPRHEHGYCVDDVARGLVVVCRQPHPDARLMSLAHVYLDFVLDAIEPDGRCHNRMNATGDWQDSATLGDWWGRAIWALGVAAVHAPTAGTRARALVGFRIAAEQRSPHLRSMVFAALGAAEVLESRSGEVFARSLLVDAMTTIGPNGTDPRWPWPQDRLTYANGSLAEAIILAGAALPDGRLLSRGLELLEFLLNVETHGRRLSVTPVGGRGRHDVAPGFDQQPIEVAAIAQACGTAFRITTDPIWLTGVELAWDWFLGNNDSSTVMLDEATGAGYDGLEHDGRNLNQGAESTLAMLATAQQARLIHEFL